MPAQPISAQPAHTTSGTAIGSLICGILGISVLPVIGSILAIVLGHLAWSEVKHSGGRVGGRGMAIAGLVLGYGAFVVGLLSLVVSTILAAVGIAAIPCGLLCGLCGM
jgi:hypothetical protein